MAPKRPPQPSHRFRYVVVLAGLLGLFGLMNWLPAGVPATPREFTFQHENILGTSLDLVVVTADADEARRCERVVLDEIERLRRLLSTYDPASAISRVNRTTGPVPCAPELLDVLAQYEVWQRRSGGALNGQLGELVRTWKEAEKQNRLPDDTALRALVERVARPAWRIDAAAGTVTRLTDQQINVNAIGRGYILSRAAQGEGGGAGRARPAREPGRRPDGPGRRGRIPPGLAHRRGGPAAAGAQRAAADARAVA